MVKRKLLLSFPFKINIDGTKTQPKPHLGFPWHYGHFIHDVVLPFSHIYLKYLENGKKITNTVLSDNKKQTIGTFDKHFNYLFNLSHAEVQESIFSQIKYPRINLDTYYFGPYPDEYAIPLKRHIYDKFSLKKTPPKHIYIIKRGVSKLRFYKNPKAYQYKTGIQRSDRELDNMEQLIKAIRKKYVLKEVVLDNMTMKKQLEIFANCKCLIGIHGAGMTNVIWLQDKSLVIEIRNNGFPASIEMLSKASNCKHERVIPRKKKVNIKKIIDILDENYGSNPTTSKI